MHVNVFCFVCFLYCYNTTKKVMLKELIQIDTELPEIYARIQLLEEILEEKVRNLVNLRTRNIGMMNLLETAKKKEEQILNEYDSATRIEQLEKSEPYKERIKKLLFNDKQEIQKAELDIIECEKMIREQKIKAQNYQNEKDKLMHKIHNYIETNIELATKVRKKYTKMNKKKNNK